MIPVTILPLKGKGFKCEAAGEEKVGDKPAKVIKVTATHGKDFTLFFDKATGLPVKEVAKLELPGGREVTTETTFADYKEFGGIKKATKIEFKSNGFGSGGSQIISGFTILEHVPDNAFAEPK